MWTRWVSKRDDIFGWEYELGLQFSNSYCSKLWLCEYWTTPIRFLCTSQRLSCRTCQPNDSFDVTWLPVFLKPILKPEIPLPKILFFRDEKLEEITEVIRNRHLSVQRTFLTRKPLRIGSSTVGDIVLRDGSRVCWWVFDRTKNLSEGSFSLHCRKGLVGSSLCFGWNVGVWYASGDCSVLCRTPFYPSKISFFAKFCSIDLEPSLAHDYLTFFMEVSKKSIGKRPRSCSPSIGCILGADRSIGRSSGNFLTCMIVVGSISSVWDRLVKSTFRSSLRCSIVEFNNKYIVKTHQTGFLAYLTTSTMASMITIRIIPMMHRQAIGLFWC